MSSGDTSQHTATIPVIVDREAWLVVAVSRTRLFVYRSVQLREDDEWYRVVKDLVGDSEPLSRAVVDDPGMMFGQAEHRIYALSDD